MENTYGSQLIQGRKLWRKQLNYLFSRFWSTFNIWSYRYCFYLFFIQVRESKVNGDGSLTDEERDLIPVSPKDSIVKQVPVNYDIKASIDVNYAKDQVYSVTFNNTESDTTGNLVVFVDLDKKQFLGKGLPVNKKRLLD